LSKVVTVVVIYKSNAFRDRSNAFSCRSNASANRGNTSANRGTGIGSGTRYLYYNKVEEWAKVEETNGKVRSAPIQPRPS
jgi:hypothetical protein